MLLRRLHIQNFKSLRDVVFDDIPVLNVLVGPNGSGKSTVLDALAFVRAMVTGRAQDIPRADTVPFQGADPRVLSFDLDVEASPEEGAGRFRYAFSADIDGRGSPRFLEEEFKNINDEKKSFPRRINPGNGESFVSFNVQGRAVDMHVDVGKSALSFADSILYPEARSLVRFINEFYSVDLRPRPLLPLEGTGARTNRLDPAGANAHAVARYLLETHPAVFQRVCQRMTQRIPGLAGIEPLKMEDGRIALRFQDGTLKTPFLERDVSDGTMDLLAWLLILNDPEPPSLLCAEEPEGQINPHVLGDLAEDFQVFSEQAGQVFLTSHSPDFLNAMPLESIWILDKVHGETRVRRAAADPMLQALAAGGDLPGQMWMDGAFYRPGGRA
ncbi:AAA family ATPase [Pararhodospirillum oryzae]|uniref:ATPase n=1 Tax=Pararhodospirillum oryzae TaxID=478448 RepID=A0A512H9K7_9PROT|nr:AAA family ATPase [Pararhodospirillum oryzae]GEO82108.1 ATPase [Pararhodospirillum oryzae]